MSVRSYNELRSQLKSWTRRNDIDDVFDSMIELVEGNMYKGENALRVRELIFDGTTACTINNRNVTLPDDYLEMISMEIVVGSISYPVEFQSIAEMSGTPCRGRPDYFCVTDQILLNKIPDQAYTINFTYYRRLPKLTADDDTNAILSEYPNIYFFGLKSAIFDYAGEPDKSALDKQQYEDEIGGANRAFMLSNFGPNLKMSGGKYSAGVRLSTTMRTR